ncbi:ATP-binding protein [Pseudoalteromonas sp. G4]|uniref:ATP-binding protein n=1 Tax=Pseudoalteromonas sp. G4 TaxID=2992761 RepID=UPI00237D3DB4|nr:ATP-binding protein [Pseudoalteromonas sp. G4]MDE3274110.1 ATP-binding protein [Pseudoalteromonas sp. G4]
MDNNEAEAKVAALERILERERLARKEAEKQLEDYTRELYQQEEAVNHTQQEVASQQGQLEFLTGLLAETWRQPNLQKIVANYLERTNNFMSNAHNLFVEIHADLSFHQFQYYCQASKQQSEILPEQYKVVLSQLNRNKLYQYVSSESESQMYELGEISKAPNTNFEYSVMVPLYNLDVPSGKAVGIAILLYESQDDINIVKLQTLESSRSMLAVAIERKRAEEALQERLVELETSNKMLEQTQQQLLQQEKLASLGQLAAGVAHEINNPIGFVLSNLDTMRDYFSDFSEIIAPLNNAELNSESKVDNMLSQWQTLDGDFLLSDSEEILVASVQGLIRVKDIVSDLSTFSRMDNDELDSIDLNVVIEKSLNVVSNEFKYHHQVVKDLLPEANILGNAGKLQQVFINLFVNAKHAMPEGGTLTISSKKDRNKIVVTVKDEGHGIDPSHLADIFTPFFTTKAPGEGTGLGLAISYSILQQHNAKVTVNSELGVGTEFEIAFFESL